MEEDSIISQSIPASEKGTPEPPKPVRNAKYYFDDPLAIFLVENQLFKVHRHFLKRESVVFGTMFQLSPDPSNGQDGFDDEHPISLPGVRAVEFERLHDYFYEEKFQRYEATMQEWIDLLDVSTRFVFEKIRERAIFAIENARWPAAHRHWHPTVIDPVDQLVLAEKHDIPHWLPTAYVSICERGRPLDQIEEEKLGIRTTVLLAEAREAVRNPHHQVTFAAASLPSTPAHSLALNAFELDPRPDSPVGNGFYHNRARVDAIVAEMFFPPPPPDVEIIG